VNAISTAPTFVVTSVRREKSTLALVAFLALLLGEILYLTVTFDTQPLARIRSPWMIFLGWTPQYLRLGISVAVVTLLLGGRQFLGAVSTLHRSAAPAARLPALVVHGAAFGTFLLVSGGLFAAGRSVAAHPALWATAWCVSGALTLVSWAFAFFPRRHWSAVAVDHRSVIGWGFAAGTLMWASGFLTEATWKYLARYTFLLVAWALRFIYADAVSIPERLIVGTSVFKVNIAPTCSGYEGIGLILAFLGIYLYLFRKTLRFPAALILLPIGAAAIWLLNAARIVALVIIGTSGWREIALGGFHSQAGWLIFNVVGLTFVAAIDRGGYFLRDPRPLRVSAAGRSIDSTAAFLGPFVAMLAVAMVTGAFSAGLDWLYPLRIAAAALVIWRCARAYSNLRWSVSYGAVGIGVVTFVVWMAMLPAGLSDKAGWPAALHSMPASWSAVWLGLRVAGYALIAPLAEELAFRGYTTRRLISADIDNVPVGAFSWPSFLLSSLIFGAFHGRLWLPGLIAGMAFAWALYRRRSLGDAVLAHATTNGLIACYVFATGHWSAWS
jgi:CAAX prenyl protease-related protein